EPVVVRFVAVAVDQDDVAGPQERLVDDLVRRRGAVGDEEAPVAAEGAGRLVLRDLDVAGRLQQAVEATGGRGGLGEEQVGPVELPHVADPVGLEDRLPTGYRQRVEGADRALGISLEIVEVRRLVAVLHAVEHRQVNLHRLLDAVKDPPDGRRLGGAGQLGDVAVDLRSEEHTSELQSRSDLVCRLLLEKKKLKNITKMTGFPNDIM